MLHLNACKAFKALLKFSLHSFAILEYKSLCKWNKAVTELAFMKTTCSCLITPYFTKLHNSHFYLTLIYVIKYLKSNNISFTVLDNDWIHKINGTVHLFFYKKGRREGKERMKTHSFSWAHAFTATNPKHKIQPDSMVRHSTFFFRIG